MSVTAAMATDLAANCRTAAESLDQIERRAPLVVANILAPVIVRLFDAGLADLAGHDRGPLHGIPYGAKDLLATKGFPTTWGAEPLRQQVFDHDATVVERLEQAGAVLVAKLAMVELAGGLGYNNPDASFTGPGRTPWNTAARMPNRATIGHPNT